MSSSANSSDCGFSTVRTRPRLNGVIPNCSEVSAKDLAVLSQLGEAWVESRLTVFLGKSVDRDLFEERTWQIRKRLLETCRGRIQMAVVLQDRIISFRQRLGFGEATNHPVPFRQRLTIKTGGRVWDTRGCVGFRVGMSVTPQRAL